MLREAVTGDRGCNEKENFSGGGGLMQKYKCLQCWGDWIPEINGLRLRGEAVVFLGGAYEGKEGKMTI